MIWVPESRLGHFQVPVSRQCGNQEKNAGDDQRVSPGVPPVDAKSEHQQNDEPIAHDELNEGLPPRPQYGTPIASTSTQMRLALRIFRGLV